MGPEWLIEARAALRVVPLEDGWAQAGTIAAALHNEMERYFAGKAGRRMVDPKKIHGPEKYIPRLRAARDLDPGMEARSIAAHQAITAARHRR